jgi:hypothetical protein
MSALARIASGLLASSGNGGDLSYATVKAGVREIVARDPMDTALVTVLGGSYLFYLAEKDVNPKVQSFWDALVFVTTCLSVGYADVFAKTPAGKAIASALMTIGPAVSGAIFDPPAEHAAKDKVDQAALVARIDALVTALEKNRERESSG